MNRSLSSQVNESRSIPKIRTRGAFNLDIEELINNARAINGQFGTKGAMSQFGATFMGNHLTRFDHDTYELCTLTLGRVEQLLSRLRKVCEETRITPIPL